MHETLTNCISHSPIVFQRAVRLNPRTHEPYKRSGAPYKPRSAEKRLKGQAEAAAADATAAAAASAAAAAAVAAATAAARGGDAQLLTAHVAELKAEVGRLQGELSASQQRERELMNQLLHSRTAALSDGMNAAQVLLGNAATMFFRPGGEGGSSSSAGPLAGPMASASPIAFTNLNAMAVTPRPAGP